MNRFCDIVVPYVFCPLAGLFLSAILTFLAIRVLPKFKMVDIPRGRHQHDAIVPCGGGVAISIAFFTVTLLLLLFFHHTGNRNFGELQLLLRNFSIPAALILIVGIIDDQIGRAHV